MLLAEGHTAGKWKTQGFSSKTAISRVTVLSDYAVKLLRTAIRSTFIYFIFYFGGTIEAQVIINSQESAQSLSLLKLTCWAINFVYSKPKGN